MKNVILFLCGFMGAGKSTFIRALQKDKSKISSTTIDLDDYIWKQKERLLKSLDIKIMWKEISHLSDLINVIGLKYFRELEYFALRQLILEMALNQNQNQNQNKQEPSISVIALGGGSLDSPKIAKLIFKKRESSKSCSYKKVFHNIKIISVWIDTPFEECLKRIEFFKGAPGRPVARDLSEEELKSLYLKRKEWYSKSDRIFRYKKDEELSWKNILILMNQN